jgi:hypothetical protein
VRSAWPCWKAGSFLNGGALSPARRAPFLPSPAYAHARRFPHPRHHPRREVRQQMNSQRPDLRSLCELLS